MKKSFPDILIALALIVFISAFAFQIGTVPADARMYPFIIMILSYILAFVLLIKNILAFTKEEKAETGDLKKQIITVVTYIIMITGYLLLINFMGYILATILFILVSLLYLKLKSKLLLIGLAVIMTVVIYYVFTRFLSVQLPRGTYVQFYF